MMMILTIFKQLMLLMLLLPLLLPQRLTKLNEWRCAWVLWCQCPIWL